LNSQARLSNSRFLLKYLLRHKLAYGLGIVFIVLTNWMVVSIPTYIGSSIDLLSADLEQSQGQLLNNIITIIVLAVIIAITRTISRILFFNPGRAIERELKDEAFAKLTALQKDFYLEHDPGTLISIVNNDINGVRALCGVVIMQVVNISIALSLTPIKMWQISPSLMLYCIVPVIVMFFIANRAIAMMREMMKKRMLDLQTMSSNTVGYLSGVEVIKSHQVQSWALDGFEKDNDVLLRRSVGLARIRTLMLPVISYTDRVMKVIILAVGGNYLVQQQLSLGEMTAFLSYATLLAMPFISMGFIFSALQNGMVSLQSLRRIFDQELDPLERRHLPKSEKQALFNDTIKVKNLTYTYPGASHPALKNISFDIRPGQKVGVLGKVGAGKTTLVNCLNRYLELQAGQVFMDNHDINELSRRDLRSAVRTITQEPFLFSDTVSANIEFGSDGLTDKLSLEEALRQGDMFDEVQLFPQQENTMVGEKGILLSGGQKQRLSLARALYTPCKLMIIDNVLSAVDNETERFLLNQIFENMRSQSTLIVSHRASVLEKVDTILVLHEGEIVAQGNHQALLKTSDLYRESWQLQQQEGQQISE